jgi:hypothetical protein
MMSYSIDKFPPEVVDEWLSTYIKSEGWPPVIGEDGIPIDKWRYLLSRKPLVWWFEGKWEKRIGHISIHDLTERNKNAIVKMALAYLVDHINEYSVSIGDLKSRISSVIEYIKINNTIPGTPILFLENGKYAISDGNHRLCAYFICYGYLNIPVPKELELLPDQNFHYWIYQNG